MTGDQTEDPTSEHFSSQPEDNEDDGDDDDSLENQS